jgi:hypothetical protein
MQETNHRSNFSVKGLQRKGGFHISLEQAFLFVASGHTCVHIRERGVESRKRMNDFFEIFWVTFSKIKIKKIKQKTNLDLGFT